MFQWQGVSDDETLAGTSGKSAAGIPVTRFMGGALDPGRAGAVTAIATIQPAGATSIGNGLQLARSALASVTGYDRQALVVFTDGLENTTLFIADVMGSINSSTYAIGLGTAQQVSTGALNALTNSTGGYLVLSGPLSPSIDEYFLLTKYFLQILAGVTNNNIVTDPSGYIAAGMKLRIPFVLNETDIDSTVILLTDLPSQVLTFLIETPAGDVMDPGQAAALGAVFAVGTSQPTQKPVELMRRPILNHTKRGEWVYDPFLGSGTTLAQPKRPSLQGTLFAVCCIGDVFCGARR